MPDAKTVTEVKVDCNPEPPDPFDPARLRVSQDFAAMAGVRRELLTVPVRKPNKEEFVRVHPDPAFRLQTMVLELKDDREVYLVSPELWSSLAGEPTVGSRMLFTAITRQNVVFLWPVRLPGPDGRLDEWSRSAMDAAKHGESRWVRVKSNMSLGAYEVDIATGTLSEPIWPDKSLQELLRIAFRDKFIDTMDHPVLRRLRGDA